MLSFPYTANICTIFYICIIFFIEFIYHSNRWRLYRFHKCYIYSNLRAQNPEKKLSFGHKKTANFLGSPSFFLHYNLSHKPKRFNSCPEPGGVGAAGAAGAIKMSRGYALIFSDFNSCMVQFPGTLLRHKYKYFFYSRKFIGRTMGYGPYKTARRA